MLLDHLEHFGRGSSGCVYMYVCLMSFPCLWGAEREIEGEREREGELREWSGSRKDISHTKRTLQQVRSSRFKKKSLVFLCLFSECRWVSVARLEKCAEFFFPFVLLLECLAMSNQAALLSVSPFDAAFLFSTLQVSLYHSHCCQGEAENSPSPITNSV